MLGADVVPAEVERAVDAVMGPKRPSACGSSCSPKNWATAMRVWRNVVSGRLPRGAPPRLVAAGSHPAVPLHHVVVVSVLHACTTHDNSLTHFKILELVVVFAVGQPAIHRSAIHFPLAN
jgi:hypothetical protein